MIAAALALAWLKTHARLTLALTGSAIVVGFILLALHWKADAEAQRAAADLAKREAAAAKATVQSVDRHAVVIDQATKQNNEERDVLRSLPGANTPTDPAERAALCASLERMRHKRVCGS